MSEKYPDHTVVSDIGSGINFKRKSLRRILEQVFKGNVSEVVVAHRDRLCRFAFELFHWILKTHGVKLVVLDQTLGAPQQELAEDLLAITQVFACRLNGKRKYKIKSPESEAERESSRRPDSQRMDGQLQGFTQSARRGIQQEATTDAELDVAQKAIRDQKER